MRPVKTGGVTIEDGKMAVLTDGHLEARITARWSDTGSNSMIIRYRNVGIKPVTLAMKGIGMRHTLGEAGLHTAVDVTNVDLADSREDNDLARTLYSPDGKAYEGGLVPGVLEVPIGATRIVDADLTPFSNSTRVSRGDRVMVVIPMASRSVELPFTAVRPPWMFW